MKKIIIIFLIFPTISIYSKTDSETLNDINIAALKGPTGLALVKMIHESNEVDSNLNFKVVSTPQLIVAGLLSGEYDAATLPTNLAAILYNKRNEFSLVSVTGDGSLYLLSSRNDIESWKDLKDKKIHNIARASTPGFMFRHLLQKNNISPEDIDINYKYNHLELAQMLIAGKVESGILPEPLVTKVLSSNEDIKVVIDFQNEYMRHYSSSYPLSCIVVNKLFIKENPEFLKDFTQSVEASINWVKKNPYDAGEMGKEIGMGVTGDIINKAITRMNLTYKSSKESKEDLLNYYKILHDLDPKSVGGEIPSNDFFME